MNGFITMVLMVTLTLMPVFVGSLLKLFSPHPQMEERVVRPEAASVAEYSDVSFCRKGIE